jgi:hypothetical protein
MLFYSRGPTFINVDNRAKEFTKHIPAMSTGHEQGYINDYMERKYTGAGEAIELGPWLGASTVAAVAGLEKNQRASVRFYRVYDCFRWHSHMGGIAKNVKLANGELFRDLFEQNTSRWAYRMAVHTEDLSKVSYGYGDIEWMFIDAFKSTPITKRCVPQFFQHLIAGSQVMHQDFGFPHYCLMALHMAMYRLRNYLVPIYHVPATSVVFRTRRKIPLDECHKAVDFKVHDQNEMIRALDYSKSLITHYDKGFDKMYGWVKPL